MKRTLKVLLAFSLVLVMSIGIVSNVSAATQSNNATVNLGSITLSGNQTKYSDYCRAIKTNMRLGFNSSKATGNYKVQTRAPGGSWKDVGSNKVILKGATNVNIGSKVGHDYRFVYNGTLFGGTTSIFAYCE